MGRATVCLVTGGRDFTDEALLYETLDKLHAETPIVRLIHGGCHEPGKTDFCGADGLSDKWARARGVPVEAYPVSDDEWERVGKAAGPRRNGRCVERARKLAADLQVDAQCVAFPGGSGSSNCLAQARDAGLFFMKVRATGGWLFGGPQA